MYALSMQRGRLTLATCHHLGSDKIIAEQQAHQKMSLQAIHLLQRQNQHLVFSLFKLLKKISACCRWAAIAVPSQWK